MGVDPKKIAIGAGVLSVGPYVAAGAAGTLVDAGLTKEATSLLYKVAKYEYGNGEQVFSAQGAAPTDVEMELKAVMAEADLEKLQWLLSQPAANLTGTAPNKSLLLGEPVEMYHQVQLVTKGVKGTNGTAASRTFTGWRGYIKNVEEIKFAKGSEQLFSVTIGFFEDLTVSTGDKFGKLADTGAA